MSDIGRFLTTYDGETEELVDIIEFNDELVPQMKELLDVPESDSDMHDRYSLGPDDAAQLLKILDCDIVFDFTKNAYLIEAIVKDEE